MTAVYCQEFRVRALATTKRTNAGYAIRNVSHVRSQCFFKYFIFINL